MITRDIVEFSFSVNDPDNGQDTGKASSFHFDDLLELGGQEITVRLLSDQSIQVSRRKYPIIRYRSWWGNWCWDMAVVTPATANAIAEYLRSLNKFSPEAGVTEILDAWEQGLPIDFASVLMTHTE